MIAPELPAAVVSSHSSFHHHSLGRPQHEDLPVPPPRPAAVDQDRTPRRDRGLHGLALHTEHGALGRVEAETLQPVAADPHDAGPRHQRRFASVTPRRRNRDHLDRARSQRLPAFPLQKRATPAASQASRLPPRRATLETGPRTA